MNQLVQLHSGDASARLVPGAGGRITALRLVRPGAGVVEILHPYPEDFFDPIRWAKGGIYPLMPYSNRIAQATVQVHGQALALKAHPDAAPHSLHGNAHTLAWRLALSDASSAVMTVDSPASAAWPWHSTGRMQVELIPGALRVAMEIRNTDSRTMPAGIGPQHGSATRPAVSGRQAPSFCLAPSGRHRLTKFTGPRAPCRLADGPTMWAAGTAWPRSSCRTQLVPAPV